MDCIGCVCAGVIAVIFGVAPNHLQFSQCLGYMHGRGRDQPWPVAPLGGGCYIFVTKEVQHTLQSKWEINEIVIYYSLLL